MNHLVSYQMTLTNGEVVHLRIDDSITSSDCFRLFCINKMCARVQAWDQVPFWGIAMLTGAAIGMLSAFGLRVFDAFVPVETWMAGTILVSLPCARFVVQLFCRMRAQQLREQLIDDLRAAMTGASPALVAQLDAILRFDPSLDQRVSRPAEMHPLPSR